MPIFPSPAEVDPSPAEPDAPAGGAPWWLLALVFATVAAAGTALALLWGWGS